jgi:arylsulfatase A-like enzyme/Flp pilus assembly protein TadD
MKIRTFPKIRILLLGLVLLVVSGLVFFLLRSDTLPGDIHQILFISVDTCRADYLSCYGCPRRTTPNIDKIAQESFIFRNAITPVPLTLPSHISMLTGTIPSYHGVHDNEGYKLDESNITLAEILRPNGFRTGAIISAFVMDSLFGLDQGFESYNDKFEEEIANNLIVQRRGGEVSRFAVDWLDEHKDEKFFLFLHYYDPHTRYEPPEPFASLYKENLYAGEVAYTDYCIGQVIAKLKELGLYDSTLIIITSDHGEMLGEHAEHTHGYYIYQGGIKVPLIIKLPGQRKARSIKELVCLIDIVPTVCSLLDIKPPPHIQGKNLSPYFHGQWSSGRDRHLYCESLYPTRYNANSILGVVTERWKYIQTTRPELYDLFNDPGETKNLVGQRPQQARMLRHSLRQILEQTLGKSKSDSKMELDEESRRRLESLGYVSGMGLSEDFDFGQSKDDPKDLIDFHLDFGRLSILLLEENYDEAKPLCEKLLSQRPGISRLHIRMGEIAVKQNDYTTAVSHFNKAVTLDPQGAAAQRSLATALALQDKLDAAVEHYEKSLQILPEQPVVLDNLARIYSRQGKVAEALTLWDKALSLKDNWPEVLNNLAWVKAAYEDEDFYEPNEAISLAHRACELSNYENAAMLDTLAVAYAAAGNFPEAIKTAEKALELLGAEGQAELAAQIQAHLDLFKSGQPYFEAR